MAMNQYIGERYTTLFADPIEWDNSRTYESLTVVIYQGASYVSRRPVPAAIDISDTRFWLMTFNYNAQIELYRQQVQQFDGRITANTEANTTQDSQLAGTSPSGLKTIIDTNTDNITTNSNDIDALEEQMAGTRTSGLKNLIDANAENISTLQSQMAGTSESGLKVLIDTNADNIASNSIDIAANTIDVSALKSNSKLNLLGGYIAPDYVGDFMSTEQFGCCCRANDLIYAFSANNYDGYGYLRIFNLITNSLQTKKNILVGHANSCAYDPSRSRIFVAPMNEYSAGQATQINSIYAYDLTCTTKELYTFPSGTCILSVSYDPTTGIMWAMSTSVSNVIQLYRMLPEESAFTLYNTISVMFNEDAAYPSTVWQDMAVYDGVMLLVKPDGTTYVFDLSAETLIPSNTYRIGMIDAGNMFVYGEVEGIEFDAQGRLYNARNSVTDYAVDHYYVNCCFVTELNTRMHAIPVRASDQAIYGTLTYVDDDVTFALPKTQIRSLNQLSTRVLGASTGVLIPAGVTCAETNVTMPNVHFLTIEVRGTLEFDNLRFFGSGLCVLIAGGSVIVNGENGFNMNNRYGQLAIRAYSNGTLTQNGQRLTRNGYAPTLTILQGLSDTYTVNDTSGRGNGIYAGSSTVVTWS